MLNFQLLPFYSFNSDFVDFRFAKPAGVCKLRLIDLKLFYFDKERHILQNMADLLNLY